MLHRLSYVQCNCKESFQLSTSLDFMGDAGNKMQDEASYSLVDDPQDMSLF